MDVMGGAANGRYRKPLLGPLRRATPPRGRHRRRGRATFARRAASTAAALGIALLAVVCLALNGGPLGQPPRAAPVPGPAPVGAPAGAPAMATGSPAALSWTAYLDPPAVDQGGVACLVVEPAPGARRPTPAASLGGRPLIFFRRGDALVALLAIPSDAQPGPRAIVVEDLSSAGEALTLTLTVRGVQFPTERLRVSAAQASLVSDDAKWGADRQKTTAARDRGPRDPLWTGRFGLPAPGPITASFGARRTVNGVTQSIHSGLDIAGERGTPVVAAAAGVAVLSDRLNITGETVIIAHGGGLFTSYCHLDRRLAAEGDRMAAGAPVGLLGDTGFATGPHLHWGVSVGTTPVDPAPFLAGRMADAMTPPRGARDLP